MGAPEDEFRRRLVWRDGAFRLATEEHPYVKTDEGPQQRVEIDIKFAISRDELTRDQWMACVNDGGCSGYIPPSEVLNQVETSKNTPVIGNYPVIRVSFDQAQEYVAWLNSNLQTDAYRLPTEAEWEYAARAGTSSRFAQGDEVTTDQANFSVQQTEFVLQEIRPDLKSRGAPVAVSELDAANAWGIRHMSGNVDEITLSCYTSTLPPWSVSSRWLSEAQTPNCERVIRGGAYIFSIDNARVAWRGRQLQDVRTSWTGFRVVKELRSIQ